MAKLNAFIFTINNIIIDIIMNKNEYTRIISINDVEFDYTEDMRINRKNIIYKSNQFQKIITPIYKKMGDTFYKIELF